MASKLFTILAAAAVIPSAQSLAQSSYFSKVFHYSAGDGLAFFGGEDYCSHSNSPAAKLVLHGVDSDSVVPFRLGRSALLLTVEDSRDQIYLRHYRQRDDDCAVGIYAVEFDDGEVWYTAQRDSREVPFNRAFSVFGSSNSERLDGTGRDWEELVGFEGSDFLHGYEGNDVLDGGDGNDVLLGYKGMDWLVGGAGNDDLYGDSGDDAYVFDPGSGNDVIEDADGDIFLFFPKTYESEVRFSRERNDLVIKTDYSGDLVRILNLYSQGGVDRIGRIEFYGSVWRGDGINRRLPE